MGGTSWGISNATLEKRKPWQHFVGTTFEVQKRMADYYFAGAESWAYVLVRG